MYYINFTREVQIVYTDKQLSILQIRQNGEKYFKIEIKFTDGRLNI